MSFKKKLLRAQTPEQLAEVLKKAYARANDASTQTKLEWEEIAERKRLELLAGKTPLYRELSELAQTISKQTDLKLHVPYVQPKEKNL